MTKFMDKLYKNYVWVIIVVSLAIYLAYRVMTFEGSIEKTINDPQTWIQLLFVIWLNVNMVSGAYDNATGSGLRSEEFELADKLNNKIIKSVNNELKDFREYVKKLNNHELISVQEDYLFKVGDKTFEELTKKELKEYKKLKPLRHNIYGFNLPLFYEATRSGNIEYRASLRKNEGKRKRQLKKVFTGVLFGAMTVNMVFNINNVGSAFLSLVIIMGGLIMTYLMTYFPQLRKFKYDIPQKVVLKNTLYNSYVEFKNGTHVLKETNKKEEKNNEKNEKDIDNVIVDNVVSNDQLRDATRQGVNTNLQST